MFKTQAAPRQCAGAQIHCATANGISNSISPQLFSSDPSPQSSLKSHTLLGSTHALLLHSNIFSGHKGCGSVNKKKKTEEMKKKKSTLSKAGKKKSSSRWLTRQSAVSEKNVVYGNMSRTDEAPGGFKQDIKVQRHSADGYLTVMPLISMVTRQPP